MDKTEALKIVSAKLAHDSWQSQDATRVCGNLDENHKAILVKHRDVAEALGILDQYLADCSVFNVDGA